MNAQQIAANPSATSYFDSHYLDLGTLTVVPVEAPARKSSYKPVDRVARGRELALAGKVTLVGRGSYAVQASNGDFHSVVLVTMAGAVYGECSCKDYFHRAGSDPSSFQCAHAIAATIVAATL